MGRAARPSSGLRLLRDAAVIAVVAVLASVLIKTFLIESFYIPSPSMEPTLQGDPGHFDRILVNRLVPSLVPLQRGDVVVFTDPGGWLDGDTSTAAPPEGPLQRALQIVNPFSVESSNHLVKRVIGLPGDHVTCCDARGRMSVNGTPLDETWTRTSVGASAIPFSTTVPAGDLWVMGDNRDDSKDSRYEGPVPVKDVTGRAFVISWPISRWTWLSNHPDVYGKVKPPSGAR